MLPNKITYVIHQKHIEGIMPKGQLFFIDKEDWDMVKQTSWYVNSNGYLRSNKYGLLSRYIMKEQLTEKLLIDHINKNRLDNRKENLRVVTPKENMHNRTVTRNSKSGHNGVTWVEKKNKWFSRIKSNGKITNLGYYENLEDAIKARKKAESELF